MISEYKVYHGSALAELLDDNINPLTIWKPDTSNNAIYLLNGKTALYVKHSTKRISPWRFSFTESHKQEILNLKRTCDHVFLVLICGHDSIGVLDSQQIDKLIDLKSMQSSWISIQTSHNTSLTVDGSKGNLRQKLMKSKPFHKVNKVISQEI